MAAITVRNLPDEVYRALKARAAAHGRSTEAEVRRILEDALTPQERVALGSFLARIGRDAGGGSPHRHIAEQSVWECRVAGCPAWGRGLQRVEAYLVGEVGHVLGACCEVGTPACVVGYGGWDAGGRRWGRG